MELFQDFSISEGLAIAIIGGLVGIVSEMLRRAGRRREVEANREDSQVKNLIEQVKQLSVDQRDDRRRIDWLEDQLWSERRHSHRQHRALAESMDWGKRMVRWADGPQREPYPIPPDWKLVQELLDTPRPRRPPPTPDAT